MKLNWGIGAFSLFGGFVIFMISLVYFASQQSHELVTEDYYEKELLFKDVLIKKERTNHLKEQLKWEIKENKLTLQFPKEVGKNVTGTIIFFKPSNEKDDKEIPFSTKNSMYNISIKNFSRGMYKMKVDWKADNSEYYNEEVVVIK